jgi:hypothetical protein
LFVRARNQRCESHPGPQHVDSQPGKDGSKPCSASQRMARRLRNDHHARITSRSTSVP